MDYQGICFKNSQVNKLTFGIIFKNFEMVDLYFEENIRLLIKKSDDTLNISYLNKNKNINYKNDIKLDNLKNLQKISNNSDDIDLIFKLINKN